MKLFKQLLYILPAVALFAACGSDDEDTKEPAPPKPQEYKLVWSDEFDGTALDSKTWTYEVNGNGGGNNEKQYYTNKPENIRVKDGKLQIQLLKENYGGKEYTSARINTKGKAAFAYGRIEARIKFPSGGGIWPAFWMMNNRYPQVPWPKCGEIDILEYVGNNPNSVINALHTQSKNGSNGQNWASNTTFREETLIIPNNYHTYGIEWTKNYTENSDRLEFFVDDVYTGYSEQRSQDANDWPFKEDFFIILNMAIGGNLGGSINPNLFDDPLKPVIMEVDYVRVYQLRDKE